MSLSLSANMAEDRDCNHCTGSGLCASQGPGLALSVGEYCANI